MATASIRPRSASTGAGTYDPGLVPEGEGNALAVAEATFRLLVDGPGALEIDGRALGTCLPSRRINLGELRGLLLADASDAAKDAAWAELVRRARSGDPAWVIGCVGVAMPGLKNVAARVLRTAPERLADDIVSELLTEFVAQLHRVDLDRPNIAPRLLLWARKGALRARRRESRLVPVDPAEICAVPAEPESEPSALLADAVAQGVVARADADLIEATRLEGVAMAEYASACGAPEKRLYKRRDRAEARLAAALLAGHVSAISSGWVSKNGS
ncbi:RNA polymerase sigma factor [Actinomadura sp. 21ATH]|uniref:RNA polymerase sigma factor n=1 Tax=Actinomadura sp. 21ATH TaxID=1735444 RepID=UPI0035BEF58E